MNGRLYDPLLRRFLNADENIQDPTNTQNYNKYGYVLNNPLMFNDPSGELIWFVPLIAAVVSEFFTMYYTQTPFDPLRLAGNVAISYISAGITGVIGGVFKISSGASTLVKLGTLAAKAGAHSFTQGVVSTVLGGNFWSGVLSAAFASVSNDLLGLAGEGSILASNGFALFSGAVTGGVGSVLGGGNFWMGAGQGLIVTAFNYLAHKQKTTFKVYDDDGDYIGKIKVLKYNSTDNGLEIELRFKSASSKYSDYNWVQTVSTNDHIDFGQGKWRYNDPTGKLKDDNSPFYYTKEEQIRMNNRKGYTSTIMDAPQRTVKPYNVWWRAELSLTGKIGNTMYEITTFKYGFNLYNTGKATLAPLTSIPYHNTYQWLKKRK